MFPGPQSGFSIPNRNKLFGVIADDLTGACDVGVQFSQAGFKVCVARNLAQYVDSSKDDVLVISTESRYDTPSETQQKVIEACQFLCHHKRQVIYQKIDSTLRGNVKCTIDVIMQTCGFAKVVINPAFPVMGRIVTQGQLQVASKMGDTGVDIRKKLGADSRFLISDATTETALESIAERSFNQSPTPLFAGSAGLGGPVARLLAKSLGYSGQMVKPPPRSGNIVLFVLGSQTALTKQQLSHLKQQRQCIDLNYESYIPNLGEQENARLTNIIVGPKFVQQPEKLCVILEKTLSCRGLISALVLSGGYTASLVCDTVFAESVEVISEIEVGIPWSRIHGGIADKMTVVTKGGGFGNSDSLIHLADSLYMRGNDHAA